MTRISPYDSGILEAVASRRLARPREVAEMINAPHATTRRRMCALAERGELLRSRGAYSEPQPRLGGTAEAALAVIRERRFPAHITGLHVIEGLNQQLRLGAVPVLVRCDRSALIELEWALTQDASLTVTRTDSILTFRPPGNSPDFVAVELESTIRQERRGAACGLAPPEKAWADLARSVLRDQYPISEFDLGRMLANGLRRGILRLDVLHRELKALNLEEVLADRARVLSDTARPVDKIAAGVAAV